MIKGSDKVQGDGICWNRYEGTFRVCEDMKGGAKHEQTSCVEC